MLADANSAYVERFDIPSSSQLQEAFRKRKGTIQQQLLLKRVLNDVVVFW